MFLFNSVFFNYKFISRFVLYNKLNLLLNVYKLPDISKFGIFFSLKMVDDLWDVSIFNYFFFFRFFFGVKAFVFNYKSIYNFGGSTYKFAIYSLFCKKNIFDAISFLIFDIIPSLDYNYYKIKLYKGKLIIVRILILDMNIFTEKKTSVGLLNIKHDLNFKFLISSSNLLFSQLFLSSLKILYY